MVVAALGLPSVASAFVIAKVALGFGLVIFIHEFGHYLMARRNGVFVEKFAIGFDFFGAKLFAWERGGTQYVVGALPLGGYVKMKGQHDLPEDGYSSEESDSFQSKTVWQRTQIISAGVIANFLSAFALCWLAMVVGYHSLPAEVGTLSFDALAEGLRPGDQIVEVKGKKIDSWEQLFIIYATEEAGSLLPIRIERDGEPHDLTITVQRDPRMPVNYPDFESPAELRVGRLQVGSAADKAGVLPGDWLVAIDGHEVHTWSEFEGMVRRRPDVEMALTVERGSREERTRHELVATPTTKTPDEIPRYSLGFELEFPPVLDFVEEGSTAWQAGLRSGDRVATVGGVEVHSWYGLWLQATLGAGETEPVVFGIAGADGEPPRSVSVTRGPTPDWGLRTAALPELGVAGRLPDKIVVGRMLEGSTPAVSEGDTELAGLEPGDVIVGFEGVIEVGLEGEGEAAKVITEEWKREDPGWHALLLLANLTAEPKIALQIEREGKRHSFDVSLTENQHQVSIGLLGVSALRKEVLIKRGPIEALGPSVKAPFKILRDFIAGIRAMALRRASARMIAGPVGILQATYAYAEKSTGDLANFLALLSVNLAIVNFLPIPITDGGHFVFLMYEKAKGRRMDEELEARFQWAGLVFILMIFLFATFNDVGRLFGF